MQQKSIIKKDIKDVVVEAISPFSRAVQKDIGTIKKDLGIVKKDIGTIKKDLGAVQKDVGQVNKRLGGLETQVKILGNEVREVKAEVADMRKNASELFVKLDKFISLYQKQESEIILLSAQVKRLEERVLQLEGK